MKISWTVVAVTALMSGCATYWDKPGAMAGEFDRDNYECQREASTMYSDYASQSQTYRTNCTGYGNNINCTSKQAPDLSGQGSIAISQRILAQESCLRARGWREVKR